MKHVWIAPSPFRSVSLLMLLAVVIAPEILPAQTMYATSGSGRGDLGSARLQAQLAVERDRIDKAEACANAGQLYGPNFAGNKSVAGCLTDLTINAGGGVTIQNGLTTSGNSTFNNNLAVTGTTAMTGNVTMAGTLAVTGTVSGATPTANSHLATKEYVDTAAASGGGGGGGGVTYLGLTTNYYDGNDAGSLVGANNKCVEAFGAGARVMSFGDSVIIGRPSAFPGEGWINCTDSMSAATDGGWMSHFCGGYGMGSANGGPGERRASCYNWTTNSSDVSSSSGYSGAVLSSTGDVYAAACDSIKRYHCVKGGSSGGDSGSELTLSPQTTTCDAAALQKLRYNTTTNRIEYCDGTSWKVPASGDMSLLAGGSTCNASNTQKVRYNANKMEYCDGTTWQAVSNGSSGGGGGCYTVVSQISGSGFGCVAPAACAAGFSEATTFSGMGGSGYNNYHGYMMNNCTYRVCCKS